MQVFSDGIYRIDYIENTAVPSVVISNGEQYSSLGIRGHKFCLYKNGAFLKRYDTSGRTLHPEQQEIETAITVLKRFML